MDLPEFLNARASEVMTMQVDGANKRRLWVSVLGLTPKRDGNQWCILWGENLQTGVAGFGPRPVDAVNAFETAMYEENRDEQRKEN